MKKIIIRFLGVPIVVIAVEKGDAHSRGFIAFGRPVPEDSTSTGGVTFMATQMNTNEKVTATAAFTDDEGNARDVDSADVTWASDRPDVADVSPNGDGSATISTGDGVSTLGAATITATHGPSGAVAAGVIEVTAGNPSVGTVNFGTPGPE